MKRQNDHLLQGVPMSRVVAVCTVALTMLALGPVTSGAQGNSMRVSPTAPLDSQYIVDLTDLHERVVALAGAIPADKYAWRPSSKVRTVSELLMHIASEWTYLCPMSLGRRPPAELKLGDEMTKLERITAKPAVLEQLGKSWETCRTSLASINAARLVPDSLPAKMGFARVVLRISGDQHEHLGQLIAYARSVDVTPPWSK
jgi:uncharacterized damage-inducible protein DinB